MDLRQLRCFVAVAEDLHFGRAALRLAMLPSALGRAVHLLEEELGARLLARTTRSVALTDDGRKLLDDAKDLLAHADDVEKRFRGRVRGDGRTLRLGAIDSASAGLVPLLLHDFRQRRPDAVVSLVEDKTIRMLPRLLSGRLDVALVRPPEKLDPAIELMFLLHETAVVAVPEGSPLARRRKLEIRDLADQILIVPDRHSRPHSHDLTIKLLARAGIEARVAHIAEEKATIVSLVAANLGVAIVPRWTSRLRVPGVRYLPLADADVAHRLPLAAAWVGGTRDPLRDALLATLRSRLAAYAAQA